MSPHAGFIMAAYAAFTVIVGGLIAWLWSDHRAQTRALARLEGEGFARRSEPPERSGP